MKEPYRGVIFEGCELMADFEKGVEAVKLHAPRFGYSEDLPKVVEVDGVKIDLSIIEHNTYSQPTLLVVIKY